MLHNIESPERGVLVLDEEHRVTRANRRALELLQADGDLIGRELPPVVTQRPTADDEVLEEVIEGKLLPGRVTHRYSTPIYSEDGTFAGRVEIHSDITARRELEREIVERNRELARLNTQLEEAQEQLVQAERLRALGEMAAGVAHDINNVLGIILGNAQLAKRRVHESAEALRSVEAIELAARDGAETVRRLREIGKPADTSHYGPVDLNEIVRDVLGSAMPAWRETHGATADISVHTELDDPECAVHGDPVELREALANVLLNAVQSIESSGRIVVSTRRDGKRAEMTVTDNGVGMDEETRKRVFDPFFTTRGAAGTGLGMSMVDAIVVRHGGRATVESTQGEGTSVTLAFPTAEEAS